MANEYRSGADGSSIALGIQSAYGTRITDIMGMLPFFFPYSESSLGEAQEVEETDLITAFGSDPEDEIGQLWADGGFTTRILVDHFFELVRGILNPELTASSELLAVDPEDRAIPQTSGNVDGSLTVVNSQPMVTDAGSTDKYVYPCKLELSITGGTAAADANMVIVGKRAGGRNEALDLHLQREVVDLTDGGGTSTKFWHEVDSIEVTGISGASTYRVNWVPETYYTEVKFRSTDVRFPGWTGLILTGGVPATVQDLVPTALNITANAQGIRARIEALGVRYEELRTIMGGLFSEQVALTQAEKDRYEVIPVKSMPGWAGAFLFGDDVVKYNSLDLNINRNLQFTEGVDGNQFRSGLSPSDNRQITFVPTTLFESGTALADTFKRWQRIFRNNERTALQFIARAYGNGGRRFQFQVETPSSQLTESPRVNVEGRGPMQRRLPFKALPTTGETSEVTFKFWTQRQIYVHAG